ncbi:MAG: hypothetical protein ACRDBO_04075 [Lachnospiraceae bacterium]
MRAWIGKKIRTVWSERKGNSTPITIAIILGILLIVCAIAEFARLSIIVSGVRDGLQQAVISVAVTNYDEVYHGLREGYSGGYRWTRNGWVENLDYDDIYYRLDDVLGTVERGDYHVKESEYGYEYRLSGLKVEISNPALAPGVSREQFAAEVWLKVEVPLSFGWDLVPPLQVNIRTTAEYLPKF